jgi:E3 ubiquitin-protein ligase HUWE1
VLLRSRELLSRLVPPGLGAACRLVACRRPQSAGANLRCIAPSGPLLLQGDVHHWVQLFDHFDAYFDKHLKGRHDLCLDYVEATAVAAPEAAAGTSQSASGGASSSGAVPPQQPQQPQQPDPPFPSAAVLSILRVTALILEGCSNKHLYSSYEVKQWERL